MKTTTDKIRDLYRKDVELNDQYRKELHDTLNADLFTNKMQQKKIRFRNEMQKILLYDKEKGKN